jgi:hypothetical protein
MKDMNRQKLRQLPPERKLYLLQQNQQIKDTKTETMKKSIPTSNSSSSIFYQNNNRKSASQNNKMRRSETSRLIFPASGNMNTNNKKLDSSQSHLSISTTFDDAMSSSPSPATPIAETKKTRAPAVIKKKNSSTNISNHGSNNNHKKPSPIVEESKSTTQIDRRAATYKYSRKNLATISNHRSRVGSMILEFDAMAKVENESDDSAAAWLLLDNKTLPRQQQLNTHTSLSSVFPGQQQQQQQQQPKLPESITVSNSVAYQSLSRKNGTNLGQIVNTDESRRRDRNSPYYYVERLRNRYKKKTGEKITQKKGEGGGIIVLISLSCFFFLTWKKKMGKEKG